MSDLEKTVSLTVNGREIQAKAGTPLIQACLDAGFDIPHYCYHQDLSVAGNCRMCVVEVEKARGLPIACSTPVSEGMVVQTDTDKVRAHRAAVMEFLLINHPIDCPICDQAGECRLQQYYMEYDLKSSRLDVDKVVYKKRVPIGPRVMLDQDRCVECTRCVRFCDEMAGTGELRMVNRGDLSAIETFPGTPLENPYSVCTADICPVGALTAKDFRFQVRAWFLKAAKSICPGCARGCNVVVDHGWHPVVRDYEGRAFRVRPRRNPAVNRSWMCDAGRLTYRRQQEGRLVAARVNEREVGKKEALQAAARALGEVGGEELLIVGALDSTLEELQLLKRLGAEIFGGARVLAVPDQPDGFEDQILIRADKHPNRQGAAWLGLLADRAELVASLAGKRAILVQRADLLALDPEEEIKKALLEIPLRVVVARGESPTAALATHLLPGYSFIEKEGHWVNFEGRLQRLFKAARLRPPEAAQDDLQILSGLSGGKLPGSAREVFASLASSLPELSGLDFESAGELGIIPQGSREGAAAP